MTQTINKMHFPSQMIVEGDIHHSIQSLTNQRLMIIGSKRSVALANWETLLPHAEVSVFSDSLPHSPETTLKAAAKLAKKFQPDAYIAIGSGSAIDLSKALVDLMPAEIIAIPTSLGGGEMTNVFGVRTNHGKKEGKGGLQFIPHKVFYDPSLLSSLPKSELSASGINSFAHCLEAFYSIKSHWYGKSAAIQGARMWPDLLLTAQGNPIDSAFGSRLFEAASLAGFAINTCGLGLHHAVCHVVGGSTGVTHGVVNAITLPKALAINREIAPEAIKNLEKALGINDIVSFSSDLISKLKLPNSLSELGFSDDSLEPLTEALMSAHHLKFNPGALDQKRAQRLIKEVFTGET